MDLSNYKNKGGVYIITPNKGLFSEEYIAVREKENRVLTDVEVQKLPHVLESNFYYKEWKQREDTSTRFLEYIKSKNKELTILDIGCGNGWFSHKISEIKKTTVIGLDINEIELEQACRIFQKENLSFVYCNLLEGNIYFENKLDIIILNASVQYFEEFDLLIEILKKMLKQKGEIHILDSPFYDDSEINSAKKRTLNYYTKIGFPKMADFYFHHSKKKVKNFEVRYKPRRSIINKLLNIQKSTFMWLVLRK